jgi:hypothetical protein
MNQAPPRYAEDFKAGDRFELGSYTVTRAELIEFARTYDPFPFHVDDNAAQATMFGGVIASGWMTALVWLRLMHRSFLDLFLTGLVVDQPSAQTTPGQSPQERRVNERLVYGSQIFVDRRARDTELLRDVYLGDTSSCHIPQSLGRTVIQGRLAALVGHPAPWQGRCLPVVVPSSMLARIGPPPRGAVTSALP